MPRGIKEMPDASSVTDTCLDMSHDPSKHKNMSANFWTPFDSSHHSKFIKTPSDFRHVMGLLDELRSAGSALALNPDPAPAAASASGRGPAPAVASALKPDPAPAVASALKPDPAPAVASASESDLVLGSVSTSVPASVSGPFQALQVVVEAQRQERKAYKIQSPIEMALEHDTNPHALDILKRNLRTKDMVADKYSLDITLEKILCLESTVWLNSEVITFWMEWWCEKAGVSMGSNFRFSATSPNCYIFHSYMYAKLMDEDNYKYSNVSKWTKKFDVFERDKIIVLINDNNVHWYLVVIDLVEKKMLPFDSMGGSHSTSVGALFRWLQDEWRDKKGSEFDTNGWTTVDTVSFTPRQRNGCDCGVFMCLFAAYESINRPFAFSQQNIESVRSWMVQTIYEVGEAAGQVRRGLFPPDDIFNSIVGVGIAPVVNDFRPRLNHSPVLTVSPNVIRQLSFERDGSLRNIQDRESGFDTFLRNVFTRKIIRDASDRRFGLAPPAKRKGGGSEPSNKKIKNEDEAQQAAREAADREAKQKQEAERLKADLKEKAMLWMKNSEKWCDESTLLENAVFERGTVHPQENCDNSDGKFWEKLWNEIKDSEHSPIDNPKLKDDDVIEELHKCGFDRPSFELFCRRLLNLIIPARMNTNIGSYFLLVLDAEPELIGPKPSTRMMFMKAFDFGDKDITFDERTQRFKNFDQVIKFGLKIQDRIASDHGGLAPEILTHLLKEVVDDCIKTEVLFESSDRSENLLYKLNLNALNGGITLDKMGERARHLKGLAILLIMCVANHGLQGVPLNIDPLLFIGMFYQLGDLREDEVTTVLFPHQTSSNFPLTGIIAFAQSMASTSSEKKEFKYDECELYSNFLGLPAIFKSPGNESLDFDFAKALPGGGKDKLLNPFFIPSYLSDLRFHMKTELLHIMFAINQYFSRAGLSSTNIEATLDAYSYNKYRSYFHRTWAADRNQYPRMDSFRDHTRYFLGQIITPERDRSGFSMTTVTVGCITDQISEIHMYRAAAMNCVVKALHNTPNTRDPPTTTHDTVQTFLIDPHCSFSRDVGEHKDMYTDRITLYISAFQTDFAKYIRDDGPPIDAEIRLRFRSEIEEVNRLLKYALKQGLKNATKEICQGLDISNWDRVSLDDFDRKLLSGIPEFISKVKKLVVEAKKDLISDFESKLKTLTSIEIDELLRLMKSEDTMVPVINDLELNCPSCEGSICDFCSGKFCSVCYCEDEPCAGCQAKNHNYSFSRFVELFTANKACSSVTPLNIELNNGVNPCHLRNGVLENTGDQAVMRIGTCFNNVILHPDGMPINALPPKIFRYMRHNILQTLSAAGGGFNMV